MASCWLIECHLFWVTTVWQSELPDTLLQPVSSWVFLVQCGNVFSSPRKCRETQCHNLGSQVLGATLEVSPLRIQRVLDSQKAENTLSIYVLPSLKEHSFFCVLNAECHILLERLAWRTFFSIIYPDGVSVGKAPTVIGKAKPPSKCLVHHIFSVAEIQGAQVFLPNTWFLWEYILRVNYSIDPKMVQPSNCLKLHPTAVFFSFFFF